MHSRHIWTVGSFVVRNLPRSLSSSKRLSAAQGIGMKHTFVPSAHTADCLQQSCAARICRPVVSVQRSLYRYRPDTKTNRKRECISSAIQLDIVENAQLSFARDMFLFSSYMRGMAYVDMAYLRKSDIQGDIERMPRMLTTLLTYFRYSKVGIGLHNFSLYLPPQLGDDGTQS